ncbi:MAG: KEOPS complex subunit Pcc1 [Actinomycetota bacterium]
MDTAPPLMQEKPAHLADYLAILRVHKLSIVLVTVACVGAAFLYASRQPAMYSSTSKVLVLQASAVSPNIPNSGGQAGKPLNLETEVEIVDSSAVALMVQQSLNTDQTIQSLLKHVKADYAVDSQVLVITYSAEDPDFAQAASQAFAESYIAFKNAQAKEVVSEQRSDLNDKLSAASTDLDDASRRLAAATPGTAAYTVASNEKNLLLDRVASIQASLAILDQYTIHPGDIIGDANLPTDPSSSSKIFLIVGLALGILLGIGQAFVRESLANRFSGIPDLQSRLRAPVFAVVPEMTRKGRAGIQLLEDVFSAPSEAYRNLRTTLMFSAERRDAHVFLITSAATGEGKTTTALNLSVALALAERSVVLVSGDLRRPRIYEILGVPNEPGLLDVLMGTCKAEQALKDTEVPGLRVLPSGGISPSPSEMVASNLMKKAVAELRDLAEFIVIDSPPMVVSDPLILGPLSDGVILVVDAEETPPSAVDHAVEQFEHAGVEVLGAVFNRFNPSTVPGYAPRYGYDPSYAPKTVPTYSATPPRLASVDGGAAGDDEDVSARVAAHDGARPGRSSWRSRQASAAWRSKR